MLLPWAKVLLVVSRNVIDEVKVKFNGVIGFGCFFSLLFFFSSLSSLLLFVKFNKTHTKHKTRNKTTKQETKQKKNFRFDKSEIKFGTTWPKNADGFE